MVLHKKNNFFIIALVLFLGSNSLRSQDSLETKKIIYKDSVVSLNYGNRTDGVTVPYEERDSVFLELYKDVVFQSSKHWKKHVKEKQTIKYWKDEVKLFFDKTVDKTVKKELLKFALDLSDKVDSLKIREVNSKNDANYFIYSLNSEKDYKYEQRIKGKDGVGYYINWDGKQQFYKCMLELNPQILFNKERLIFDAKKDFFSSLGFFHKTVILSCDSFLAECNSSIIELSKIDLEILRYHYSYGICKGTDLQTFEDQHERAKEILNTTNHTMLFLHKD
ncbi:hypothetical protein AB9K24_10360 [Meridianimaribacter flavus]